MYGYAWDWKSDKDVQEMKAAFCCGETIEFDEWGSFMDPNAGVFEAVVDDQHVYAHVDCVGENWMEIMA